MKLSIITIAALVIMPSPLARSPIIDTNGAAISAFSVIEQQRQDDEKTKRDHQDDEDFYRRLRKKEQAIRQHCIERGGC